MTQVRHLAFPVRKAENCPFHHEIEEGPHPNVCGVRLRQAHFSGDPKENKCMGPTDEECPLQQHHIVEVYWGSPDVTTNAG